jgi:LysM repeat protein
MGGRITGLIGVLGLLVAAQASHAAPPLRWNFVTVRTGDTLSEIAKREHIPLQQLATNNGITNPDFIRAGQRLKTHPGPIRTTASAPQRQSRRASEDTLWVTHRIRPGDTLWSIGKRYGVKTRYLIRHNSFSAKRLIHPGNEIRVKKRHNPLLVDGVQLQDGVGYVRLRPQKSWGTAGTVRMIQHAYKQFAHQYPHSVPGYVADLSKFDGGHLPPHRSHQRGVDVDISYYKKGNVRTHGLEVVTSDTIDIAKTWDLMRHFLNTRHVPVIFMDYDLQRTLHSHLVRLGYDETLRSRILQYPRSIEVKKGIIRHSPGHHHHLHVRFDCLHSTDTCATTTTTWIAARVEPVRIALAPAADGERRQRRSDLESGPIVVDTTARPPSTVLAPPTTDAPIVENNLLPADEPRVVRGQETESRRSLPTGVSMIERHWVEFLRSRQGNHGLASQAPPRPVGARTAERPARSERFGPSSETQSAPIDAIQ